MYCKNCGAELDSNAVICPKCGAVVDEKRLAKIADDNNPHRNKKSKNVAGTLAFFLGGLGIHRFYLGQWWGIFYLLFVWTYIPAIISFFEALAFWFGDEYKFDQKYNR